MTYYSHNPNPREREIIETAYRAQQSYGHKVTNFVMPTEVPYTPYSEDASQSVELTHGTITIGGKNIRGAKGPTPVDGDWDQITYGGEEWLAKDGRVLKKIACADAKKEG